MCHWGIGPNSQPIQEGGGKYSPIDKLAKQTLQTTRTNNTATQQTKFLIRVEFPGCYNTTPPTRDLVLRSRTIRGRGGGDKRETTISTPPTRDSASRRRRTSVKKTFRRKTTASKDEAI